MLTLSVGFVAVIVLWRRAEANFGMSMEMVGDLMDLVAGGEEGLPKAQTIDHLIAILERQRTRLLVLAASRPDDLSVARHLGHAEAKLSFSLIRAKRHAEARILLLESIGRTEDSVRRHPSDRDLRSYLLGCLQLLADASERLGKTEDCILYRRRIIQSCEEEIRCQATMATFARVIGSRRDLAWLLYGLGDLQAAGALAAANQQDLEHPPVGCEGLLLTLQGVLCRLDSSELLSGAASPTSSVTGNDKSHSSSPLSRLAAPTHASQSPEDWARLAAQALRCIDPDPRSPTRHEAENALAIMEYLATVASIMRKFHHVDKSGHIADSMLALAHHVIARHPDEPASYLSLSAAYKQMYKNAYESQPPDMASVETNMSLALDAAQEALRRNLNREKARHAVDELQRRLAELHPNG